MCLIYVAWRRHPRYRLIVAANRDEYHARPAAPAHWWQDAPGVLAGRDLEAGGTWMGITREGRFAAVTNYRDPSAPRADGPSRGALVGAFLAGGEPARDYLERVAEDGHRYNGFSLLAMDGETLGFVSNRARGVTCLEPGIFGLSNHLLDTPWPKVVSGKAVLERLVAESRVRASDLLALLAPHDPASVEAFHRDATGGGNPRHGSEPAEAPPADNGDDFGRGRSRSSRFILGDAYGTRASTVVLLEPGAAGAFVERSFDARGAIAGDVVFDLDGSPPRTRAG